MSAPRPEIHWEVEVRSKDGGHVLGDFVIQHERKRDAVTEVERIRPEWAKHEWGCTVHVIRVERKVVT